MTARLIPVRILARYESTDWETTIVMLEVDGNQGVAAWVLREGGRLERVWLNRLRVVQFIEPPVSWVHELLAPAAKSKP